ncbi:allantoinase AllB [Streptomonospora alba]|uniref:allantoinase AllB n=1 Tax=Streptomonospora alba TaxID=183763 RepID=UPI00069CA2AD|nr:allantoinase AllB [Streptomonospora alba]
MSIGGGEYRGEGAPAGGGDDCDLIVRALRAVTPEGERAVSVGVRDGRIAWVGEYGHSARAARTVETAGDEVLLPGLVDSHVHINEPGRTEWEGFATATRAAAAGGVTTLVDMPLNSVPPTTTLDALEEKRAAADGAVAVDVAFWGGAVPENSSPETAGELRRLHEAGVCGFKAFLAPSGVEEFGHLGPAELRTAAEAIGAFGGLLIVHAEDPAVLAAAPAAHGRDYAAFAASRPEQAEAAAVRAVVEAARATGARTHILHLSSSAALPEIARARAEGVPVTAETCPHYLTLAAEDVPPGATQYKCCPPIRGAAERDALWQGLAEGVIDCVVSDHSPSPPALKNTATGDFATAWGGISGLQVGFSAVWTAAAARGHRLADVAAWMSRAPAEIAGLSTKGVLEPGRDADFAVVAPEDPVRVDAASLHHRHPLTPYDGRDLVGRVRSAWLRGDPIDPDGRRPPRGRLLTRG